MTISRLFWRVDRTAHPMPFCAISAFLFFALTASAWSQPAPADPNAPAPRNAEEIQKDLAKVGNELADLIAGPEVLLDIENHEKVGLRALPVMRKMSDLYGELAAALPELKDRIAPFQTMLRAMMGILGEKQATSEIARLSVSTDAKEAADARATAILVNWVKARKDPAAQEKLAKELSALAKNNPQNQILVEICSLLSEAAATPALAQQVERVVAEDLQSDAAAGLAKTLDAKRKIKAIDGKPLVIEGLAVDGSKFSSAQWKGKVVLVDFWATWCGPCIAELPKVKKMYAEHHAKGLEIVGISCDKDGDKLRGFLDTNKDMSWPQLFDPAMPGWHPLTEQFGVTSIPTMFLIDKKGVVRSVKARENYEELIPKLLAE